MAPLSSALLPACKLRTHLDCNPGSVWTKCCMFTLSSAWGRVGSGGTGELGHLLATNISVGLSERNEAALLSD